MLMARRPNFLRNLVPALPLLAKNDALHHFLNAQTQGFKSDFTKQTKNKNQTDWSGFCFWRRQSDLNRCIRVLQTRALPLGYVAILIFLKKIGHKKLGEFCVLFYGADDEARTRYLHLGKVALYQMSYIRIMVPPIGIEPMTRGFSVLCSTN